MQIPHSPPSPPGTCSNHSHCWHTSQCCFHCHGSDKQVVLINFALKNEPGTHVSIPSWCLSVSCWGSFTRPDNAAAEIPEGSVQTSSPVMTHLVLSAWWGNGFLDLKKADRYLSKHKTQTDRVTQTKLTLLNGTAAALFPTDPNDEENVQVRPQR